MDEVRPWVEYVKEVVDLRKGLKIDIKEEYLGVDKEVNIERGMVDWCVVKR